MSKLAFLLVALAPFAVVAACSQPDTRPPLIKDCAECVGVPTPTGGGPQPDASTADVENDTTIDAFDDTGQGD